MIEAILPKNLQDIPFVIQRLESLEKVGIDAIV
jgi:hypothetical protein